MLRQARGTPVLLFGICDSLGMATTGSEMLPLDGISLEDYRLV
jgi:hypothetical protein